MYLVEIEKCFTLCKAEKMIAGRKRYAFRRNKEAFVLEKKTKKYKLLSLFIAVAMVFCMVPAVAMAADGDVVQITNSQELVEAIKNQQDGQTWVLAAGEYDVADGAINHVANINNVASGFVFPIHANNLTIRGEGDVTITSSHDTNTGNWAGQNFITVGGSNVTIENVKLRGNYNTYYKGCNKVLETIGTASNFTMRNVECLPLTTADGAQNSGSIYINTADAGNTVLENVTLYSWINARAVTTGSVTANNVVQDFTNHEYAGYSDATYGYAWNPGISGDNVTLNGFTIKVDDKSEFIQQIANNLKPGTTIELMSDIRLSEEFYIHGVDNITVNGNGHTITAGDNFTTNIEGQIQLVKVESNNVTLNDVNLVATSANKHTLDVYGSQNLQLNNVTLNHENGQSGAPLIVNGSTVVVNGAFGIVTGDNSWYGVNLDNKSGEASLTFAEGSALTFTDNSSTADKLVIVPEASDTSAPDPEVINHSSQVNLTVDENGNYIQGADYTKVDAAIAKANALNRDDYVDFTPVDNAIAAVVRDLDISKQAEVDAMAQAIEDAIAGLQRKQAAVSGSYQITAGADGVWSKGSTAGLSVTSNGDFTKFTGIKVDGADVAAEHYTAVSGSTVVTLNPAYLETLTEGVHTLTLVYTDGEVTTNFTIAPAGTAVSPQTGDSSNITI